MDIDLELSKESIKNLRKFPERFKKGTLVGFRKAMYHVESTAKRNFGGPGNLKVRTGYLRNSIKSSVDVKQDRLEGVLSSNAVYAPVHEFGATIKPTRKSILKWQDRDVIFANEVKIPKRPFMKPAIEQSRNDIERIIRDEVDKEANK